MAAEKWIFGFKKTKTVLIFAAAAVYLALVVLSGGNLFHFALTAGAACLWILLPGRFWSRLFKTDAFLAGFAFPFAAVLGIGSFALCYCIAALCHTVWILRLVPLCTGLAGLVIFPPKREALHRLREKPCGSTLTLMLLCAALIFVYGWAGAVKYAHPAAVGEILINQDFLWNAGNAQSFLLGFPPADLRVTGVPLTYHYLNEMITACLSLVTGVPCYDILAFYQQPLLLCALIPCLYSFGSYFFAESGENRPLSLLFTFSMFLFGCASLWKILPNGASVFLNSNIRHLVTNINSQTLLILQLTVFTALFLKASEKNFRTGPVPFVLILASFVMLCFSKSPAAAIAACAAVLTVLILLPEKKAGWQGLMLAACIGAIFAFVYFSLFSSGTDTSITMTLSGTLEKGWFGNLLRLWKQTRPAFYRVMLIVLIPVQTLLMMPAAVPLAVQGLFGDLRHFARMNARELFPTACAGGGMLAFFLFDHWSLSQLYFFLIALFFLHLLAVRQLEKLIKLPASGKAWKNTVRRLWKICVGALAAVGLITAGFCYINLCGSGLRQLLHNYDILEKYPYECLVTADDENAARWLRENTDGQRCVFATNRIHSSSNLEGISNVYSAFSGRQGYMEGLQYAITNMDVSGDTVERHLKTNETLFRAGTDAGTIRALCRQEGITHLVYSRQMIGDESQLAAFPCVYRGPDVRIYEIAPEKNDPNP